MMALVMALGMILLGYLLGSVNSAMIVCQLMGLPSPRSVGSGNPGATNVLRLGSKKAAAITLIGDALKGWIPVFMGHLLGLPIDIICWIALAAVLGHVFPLFFGFKGGKGVATGLGVLLGIQPFLGLAVLGTWLIVALCFRYSSLAALISVILMPIYGYFLLNKNLGAVGILVLIGVLILVRHQSNIKRLVQGQETKIGQKKALVKSGAMSES
jgi:glycerol-3-phosphate acyltransferase PlsY